MSYLGQMKNFSHCPLKKRPLNYITDCDESEKPQDLSVKRLKTSDDEVSSTVEKSPLKTNLKSSPLKPSPLPCYTPHPMYNSGAIKTEPIDKNYAENVEPRLPSLADFYLQLFQQSTAQEASKQSWDRSWPVLPSGRPWNINPTSQSALSPPIESNLSSPRSTSSEDSGLGSEFVSEDEIESRKEFFHKSFLPHTCNSCGKTYSTEAGLKKHNELHCTSLGPKVFSCQHCAKTYTSIGALKMHIRTHTLPCKCHVCGKAFSRPWLLQGHIRTHTGEKPFECQQCNRSFADRSNLRAHQQTHEKVKKYACQTCSKTFSRMSLLSKHAENACPGKPFLINI